MENIFSWQPAMKWYLNSFREKFVSPLIALTGYKPPKISIQGEEVVVVVENNSQAKSIETAESLSPPVESLSLADFPRNRAAVL